MPSRGEGLGPPCSVQAAVSAAVWRLQVARGVGAGSRHAGSVRQGRAERGAETPRSSPPIRSPGGGWCRQDPGDGHRWPPGHRPRCAAPAPRRRRPCRPGRCVQPRPRGPGAVTPVGALSRRLGWASRVPGGETRPAHTVASPPAAPACVPSTRDRNAWARPAPLFLFLLTIAWK